LPSIACAVDRVHGCLLGLLLRCAHRLALFKEEVLHGAIRQPAVPQVHHITCRAAPWQRRLVRCRDSWKMDATWLPCQDHSIAQRCTMLLGGTCRFCCCCCNPVRARLQLHTQPICSMLLLRAWRVGSMSGWGAHSGHVTHLTWAASVLLLVGECHPVSLSPALPPLLEPCHPWA
jgi:hypothetical protein